MYLNRIHVDTSLAPHTPILHTLTWIAKSILVRCILHHFLSDPPLAEAVLFTDKSTIEKIEKLLTDEKYTTPLKLVVEECDKEKLKAQEEAPKERAFPEQKKTFTQAGRGKKKGIFLIRLICTHF